MIELSAPADRVVYSGDRVKKTDEHGYTATQVDQYVNPPVNPPVSILDGEEKNIVEQSILVYCQEYRSAKEVMSYLGYKDIRYFRKTYLRPLIDAGRLLPLYPESMTARNQKYITKR